MSFVFVPTDTIAPFWSQTTTLDGVAYLLNFVYSARESCYYLQIQSSDGVTTYAQGIKIVTNFPLLRPYTTPPGELFAVAPTGDDSTPALGELGIGQRVVLRYLEEADLAANGFEPERFAGFLP